MISRRCHLSKRRWLLLPIDTKAREFYAKVLLSCEAAERGWGVMFGKASVLRSRQEELPRGTYLDKSISPGRFRDISKAHRFGNRVSAWCEEGLLYLEAEDYRQRRFELQSFEAIDYFFAWGANQAEDIRAILATDSGKIVVSGNPRFDLLRPELRGVYDRPACRIRERYGRFILINTKFAMCNHNLGPIDIIEHYRERGKIRDVRQEALMRDVLAYQRSTFDAFRKMVCRVAEAFPSHSVIIRTHPSESAKPWNIIAEEVANLLVLDEGNANEWMLAADVIIQNNCTTAIEGFLLDRKVVSYRPVQNELVEPWVINQIGWHVSTESELIDILNQAVYGGLRLTDAERKRQVEAVKTHVANVDGPSACESIMHTLDGLDLPVTEGRFPLRKSARDYARQLRRYFKSARKAYLHKKYPGIRIEEIQQLIAEFQAVTARFDGVEVTSIGDNGFCIYRA